MPLRPTFAMLRSSNFPKNIGTCASDLPGVALAANSCMERLSIDPLAPDEGWWGGWALFALNVQPVDPPNGFAYVVTPRNVARLILLDVCSTPVTMRNGFFEFLKFSSGLQPKSAACGNGSFLSQSCACTEAGSVFERDNVATLTDFPGTPQFIRLYPTNSADIGKRVLVQGPDQNGKAVLGVDATTGKAISGEYVMLAFPFAQTLNQFSAVSGLNKDSTLGPVQAFTVDPPTGTQTLLSTLDPGENTSWYRRYLITGLPRNCCNTPSGTVTLTAQARLDFLPVQSDPDYLYIPNIPALEEEGQALRYSRMDTTAAAQLEQKHHAKAIGLLNGQLDLYEGKVNVAITVPLAGSDRFRLNPR